MAGIIEVGGRGNGLGPGALTSKYTQNPILFHHLYHYQLGHSHQHLPPGFLHQFPNGLPASKQPHFQPAVGATLLEPTLDHACLLLRTLWCTLSTQSKSPGFYNGLQGPAWSGSHHPDDLIPCSSLVSLMSPEYTSDSPASRALLQLFPLPQKSASLNSSPETAFSWSLLTHSTGLNITAWHHLALCLNPLPYLLHIAPATFPTHLTIYLFICYIYLFCCLALMFKSNFMRASFCAVCTGDSQASRKMPST